MIFAIVTADKNWGIGKSGRKLISIPDDEKYLIAATAGQTVIMGRKTFESVPASRNLTSRNTVVLSRDENLQLPGAVVAHSPEEALEEARKLGGDIYILGGESIFEQMLHVCDEVQVTAIDYSYDADARFPNLDKSVEWVQIADSDEQTYFDTIYYFRKYEHRKDYRG